jgi:predicted transcriptional regulator YdeE
VLPEGLYAIFTHRGDPAGISALYAAVQNYWFSTGKYIPAPSSPYVVYLSNAMTTPPAEQLSELYVPIHLISVGSAK